MQKIVEISKNFVVGIKQKSWFNDEHSVFIGRSGDSIYFDVEESVEVVRTLKQLYYELTGEVMEA